MMINRTFLLIFYAAFLSSEALSLSVNRPQLHEKKIVTNDVNLDRRMSFSKMAYLMTAVTMNAMVMPQSSLAEVTPGTKFVSGRAPKVPGAKKRDPGDTKGTRKDPNFLRSLSDCKSKCDKTLGPDGLAKSKEDCLSDCQDICCTTYEQCTFAIVPRI